MKTVRIKNISDIRVGIVGIGDLKPNEIKEISKKAWKLLHKPWPESRPYRCENIRFLVEVDKKGKPLKKVKKPKPKKPDIGMSILGNRESEKRIRKRADEVWSTRGK